MPHAQETLAVTITRTHLSHALTAGFVARSSRPGSRILFAPYVPPKLGRELASSHLSYADPIGNCHLTIGREHHLVAHVEGKKPTRIASERAAGRAPSHRLTFAILAKPALLDAPVRDIALAAGVGKTAAAENLNRLIEQGFVVRTRAGSRLVRERELLDRWITAYTDVLRPHMLLGTYRTQAAEPEALERHLESVWSERTWAFGGGAAAWRMMRHYRGPTTVVHIDAAPSDALREARAIPAQEGNLTLLRTTSTLMYEGTEPHLVHPLLVYAEMATSTDPRMTEAAQHLRERFIVDGM
jgi:hypothetical protein